MDHDSFTATFELAAIGLGHVTLDGRWVTVNKKLCEIVGYTADELKRMTFQDITHPDDLDMDLERLEKLSKGAIRDYSLEKRYVRKDGKLIWIRLNVSMYVNKSGDKICIAVVEEIGDRKAVERALATAHRELEARVRERTAAISRLKMELDSFFDLNSDIMAILGSDGIYRRVNPALCSLYGLESYEICGGDSLAFIVQEDRKRVSELREAANADLLPRYYEARHITQSGAVCWIAWSEITVGGEEKSIFATGRDITMKKMHQARAVRTRRAMETRSKLRVLGSMAANMAHEINNPLTVILGEGYRLRKFASEEKVDKAAVARISENVIMMGERIMTIVRGLQTAARDSSEDPFVSIPISELLDQLVPFCRGNPYSQIVKLLIEPYDKATKLFCQPEQMTQILLNLINNAFDAAASAPPPKQVTIAVKLTQVRTEIHVTDSGEGICEEIRSKLFQPFVTTKGSGQGLGLSLNLSKNMIQLQNGELYFDRAAEKTTFVVSMPRTLRTHLYSEL